MSQPKRSKTLPVELRSQLESLPKGFIVAWLRARNLKGPATDALYKRLDEYFHEERIDLPELENLVSEYMAFGKKKVFLFSFHPTDRNKIGNARPLIDEAKKHPCIVERHSGLAVTKEFELNGFVVSRMAFDRATGVVRFQLHRETSLMKVRKGELTRINGRLYAPVEVIEGIIGTFVDVDSMHGRIDCRLDPLPGIGAYHKLKDPLIEGIRQLLGLGVPRLSTHANTGDKLRSAKVGPFSDVTRKYEHTEDTGHTIIGYYRVQTSSRDVSDLPGADSVIVPEKEDSYFRRFKIRWDPKTSSGNIERSITTIMNVDTGEISFQTPCFQPEMNYVLSRVRSASRKA